MQKFSLKNCFKRQIREDRPDGGSITLSILKQGVTLGDQFTHIMALCLEEASKFHISYMYFQTNIRSTLIMKLDQRIVFRFGVDPTRPPSVKSNTRFETH